MTHVPAPTLVPHLAVGPRHTVEVQVVSEKDDPEQTRYGQGTGKDHDVGVGYVYERLTDRHCRPRRTQHQQRESAAR